MFLNVNEDDDRARLLARVLRSLIAHDTFDTYADLADALKYRLARLRIRYTADDITAAIALVESNTAVVRPLPLPRALVERPPEPSPDLPKAAATALCKTLRRELETRGLIAKSREPILRRLPAVNAPRDPDAIADEEQAARERAWEMGIEL